jgi:multiple sugar transport system substrate-binding protein
MKKSVWIVLFVVLAMIVTACAPAGTQEPVAPGATSEATPESPSGEKVTITLWAYEGYQDFLPVLIEGFEAKYPNINVELTNIPEDQYGTKLETALAAGAPPDLGFVGDPKWVKNGVWLPLDDAIAKEGIDLSTWNQGIIGPKGVENAIGGIASVGLKG